MISSKIHKKKSTFVVIVEPHSVDFKAAEDTLMAQVELG